VDNLTIHLGLLGAYELDERHTSEFIASKMFDVCIEWDISTFNQSIISITTDGAANMFKAVELAFAKKTTYYMFYSYTRPRSADSNLKCH